MYIANDIDQRVSVNGTYKMYLQMSNRDRIKGRVVLKLQSHIKISNEDWKSI